MPEIFSVWMGLVLLAAQLLPLGIWRWQRREGALGGPISLVKAYWLVYAAVLWILMPILLWPDHLCYRILAVSMLLRVAVEIPLCLRKTWKVRYGLAHDFLHLALLLGLVAAFSENLGFVVLAGFTGASLVTEMVFVRWFAAATQGPEAGIYFVPGGAPFRAINRRSAIVFLPQYALFLILIGFNLFAHG